MAKPPSRLRAFLWLVMVFFVSVFIGGVAGAVAGYLKSAPALEDVIFNPELTTYIYDREGRPIARFFREHRIPVRLEDIPWTLRAAVIAVEDHRFYEHRGLDFIGIARALWVDLRGTGGLQGASTITQQLARNAFLTHDRTIARKLQEVLWAIQIERKYTKDEILETYLNEVYFGHGAYGVEAASRVYFGKSVRELDLAESALIAGLLRGPGYYSPRRDMEAALRRRAIVLNRMVEVGYITEEEARQAREQPIILGEDNQPRNVAPHFVSYVLRELLDLYGDEMVYGGGLHVYTTLDLDLQAKAEAALESSPFLNAVTTVSGDLRQPQAALISIDPRDGSILAMVGGRDRDHFNRAVQALRQPGSAFKPFVYVAAIEKGLTPATVRVDEPFRWEDPHTGSVWEPRNYSRTFLGPVTLRTALEQSINVIAVRLLHEDVSVRDVIRYARRLGITTLVEQGARNDLNLALSLGGLTRGVRLIEMAQAFGVFANQGIRVQTRAITRVLGPDGRVIDEFRPIEEAVLSEQTAYIMTDMLRGVIERGTGRRAQIGRPAAGKTGTSQDFTNAWFVGYTPEMVTAVWIGNDLQSEPMTYPGYGNIGSALPAEIWGRYMRAALEGRPVTNFAKPSGLVEGISIDTLTGLRVSDNCNIPLSQIRQEVFIAGTEPLETSPRCLVAGTDSTPRRASPQSTGTPRG